MTDRPTAVSIVPTEVQPSTCGVCGGSDDLDVRQWRGHEGSSRTLWYAVCRACLHDDIRRGAALQVAHWQRIADAPIGPASEEPAALARRLRLVAEGLRDVLAGEGVEPDDVAAAFISRYAAS